MLIQLLNRLGIFVPSQSPPTDSGSLDGSRVSVKEFVDLELDAVGWYALGHCNAEQFLAAIARHQPIAGLHRRDIERTWALFQGTVFEQCHQPLPGAIPVTLILVPDPPSFDGSD